MAEVKSCTIANQESQLRLGLGQVLRYRAILAERLKMPVRAVLMAEMEPIDKTWKTLCDQLDTALLWPEALSLG